MFKNHNPGLEQLESRRLPAVTFTNGVVFAQAPDRGEHGISAFGGPDNFSVAMDGVVSTFSGVKQLVAVAGRGGGAIQNNTNVPALLLGGSGRDTLFTGTGSDVALPGPGQDVVYSLLGRHQIVTAGQGQDRVFSNPNNSLQAGPEDRVVTFFQDGRTPGSNRAELVDGVLYLTPPNGGSFTQLSQTGSTIILATDWSAGTQTFNRKDVVQIAYFGGSGDDTFVNDTSIDDVFYGSAGDDLLVGGTGDYSLAKGSGGDDTIVVRARRNDLSANSGTDTLIALDGRGDNTFRIDQGAVDSVFGSAPGDLFLSP